MARYTYFLLGVHDGNPDYYEQRRCYYVRKKTFQEDCRFWGVNPENIRCVKVCSSKKEAEELVDEWNAEARAKGKFLWR